MVYVSDNDLVNMRTKELNDYLKNVTKAEAKQIKIRRRLLKNRGYAQSTRAKRVETKEQLETRKAQLVKEIEQLKRNENNLLSDLSQLRRQRERLESEVGGQMEVEIKNEEFY